MTRAILVLAVALLAGCEGKTPQSEPVMKATLGYLTTDAPERVTVVTCLMPEQEEIGRTIVMVARGWSDWPKVIAGYVNEDSGTVTWVLGEMLKPGTHYEGMMVLREVQP